MGWGSGPSAGWRRVAGTGAASCAGCAGWASRLSRQQGARGQRRWRRHSPAPALHCPALPMQVMSDWGFVEKMRGEAAVLLERLEGWVEKQAGGMEAARSPERLQQHFDSLLKVMDALYQVGGRAGHAGVGLAAQPGCSPARSECTTPSSSSSWPLASPPAAPPPPAPPPDCRSSRPRAPLTCWWTSCARCLARWPRTRFRWPRWRSAWTRWRTGGTTSRRRSRRSRARSSPSRYVGGRGVMGGGLVLAWCGCCSPARRLACKPGPSSPSTLSLPARPLSAHPPARPHRFLPTRPSPSL
jgi:hypothetical protein